MLEPGRDLDLPEETIGPQACGQLRAQNLDGDLTVVLQVLRQVHRPHSALPQCALEAIAVAQGFCQARRDVSHEEWECAPSSRSCQPSGRRIYVSDASPPPQVRGCDRFTVRGF